MLRTGAWSLAVCGLVALAGCEKNANADVNRAIDGVNVIDQNNLNELMLTVADPEEGVAHFERALAKQPERVDLKRGLARSLVRARRAEAALPVWREIVASPEATDDDRLGFADALVRTGAWEEARAELDRIPPTYETYERYRLEAMVADARQDWRRAESFYATAAELASQPAGLLNNWGYSRLMREDYNGAEKLFIEALQHDPGIFTAKNNLAIARAGQRNYSLPVIEMTQTERAQLLHTLALGAIKQGDVQTGRVLLRDAVETHPQHFEAAARSLAALEG